MIDDSTPPESSFQEQLRRISPQYGLLCEGLRLERLQHDLAAGRSFNLTLEGGRLRIRFESPRYEELLVEDKRLIEVLRTALVAYMVSQQELVKADLLALTP